MYFDQVSRSILEQTYEPIELIVLDNASPEEMRESLDELVANFDRGSVLRIEERVPVFANFNRGVRAATGKYICFFHDDDFYHPRFVERYVEMLEANPRAVFAGGNFSVVDQEGTALRANRRIERTGYWTGGEFIDDLIRRGRCALPTPGLVFRTEALAVDGFDESLPGNWGDFPIFMRLAERGDVAVSEEEYFSWRVHGTNGSNIPFSVAIPERTRLFADYLREYEARHPHEKTTVRKLARANQRNHRIGLIWGWLTAADEADAGECRRLLRRSLTDRAIAGGLRALEALGWSLNRRRRHGLALRAALGASKSRDVA